MRLWIAKATLILGIVAVAAIRAGSFVLLKGTDVNLSPCNQGPASDVAILVRRSRACSSQRTHRVGYPAKPRRVARIRPASHIGSEHR
jgi:hypothetical protein